MDKLIRAATEGDIAIPRPGLLDMLGRSKWDSWNKQKGKSKDTAKGQYVDALLNILRKYGRTAISKGLIAELEAFDPATALPARPHSRPSARARAHARSRSPGSESSSSGGSFHSSQASPPRSPSPPPNQIAHTHTAGNHAYSLPDPNMPVPDVRPEIIPPSALNASHKSLLSLASAAADARSADAYQESQVAPPAQAAGQMYAAYRPDLGSQSHAASRAHSLLEGRAGPGAYDAGYGSAQGIQGHGQGHVRGSPSVHSLRSGSGRPAGQAASALGFAPLHPHSQAQPHMPAAPGPGRYLTTDPGVIARDFTPDPGAHSPYLPYRPGTPSTFAVPPINIPSTLQQIQTSLTALHERLSTLERAQGLLLRREERKRASWFGGILSGRGEEEDLDEAEEEAERERRGMRTGVDVRNGRGSSAAAKRSRLAVVWWCLKMIRRLMVDVTVGAVLAMGVILVFRGWRGGYGRRLKDRFRGLIRDAR